MLRQLSRMRNNSPIVFHAGLLLVLLSSGCIMAKEGGTGSKTDGMSSPTVSLATIFEVYAGNSNTGVGSPYEMLLVRGDGLVYYEAGSRNHFRQTSDFTMRQGQLTAEEVARLRALVEKCPRQVYSKFGSDQFAFTGPYAVVYSPTRAMWALQADGSRITANFDPFTQDLTGFPDIPDAAKVLLAEMTRIVEATLPTDVHPALWPDQHFDGRNYEVVTPPGTKV